MVMLVPTTPLPGEKEVSLGSTLNVARLCPEPAPVRTVSLPVEASAGTGTVILVASTVAGTAATPLKSTFVAPPTALPLDGTGVAKGAGEGVEPGRSRSTASVPALVAVSPRGVAGGLAVS